MHWCMATVCQSAMFPSWVWGRGPKKRLRGPDSEVVLSPLHDKTVENHFYKGGFFCALAHGHSMPVCNFFLMDLGEGSQETHKKITEDCAVQHGEVVFSSLYEKKRSKITFKGGCFLCSGAWPQYAGSQFFPHGSGGGLPRNKQKIYRGLRGPAW